jgi:SAM-dependent methyltransferase
MSELDRRAHWDGVYASKQEAEVSWFEATPLISLDLIRRSGTQKDSSIIDIGGGASRLADALLDEGYRTIAVLDLSEKALAASRARLGSRASQIQWIAADVTRWEPKHPYDLWHDRAAFHFLTLPEDRQAYLDRLMRALAPGGHVIIGTFALDGPDRCSGLPVVRYDAASLGRMLGQGFQLKQSLPYDHRTPWGSLQRFQFSLFHRLP